MSHAPRDVRSLVERFQRNKDNYKDPSYNETQVRREFIDPLFKALGWDIDNERGYAEAYKDVIHEDAIKVGGATKAPDYCFRIGGTRKFFLEAKKPAVPLKEHAESAFQLRRYAWSARLPLSILTDFEELAVYDGRVRPHKADKSSTARTMYFTYDQYEDRWDKIAAIFSRDAVLKGSFDRYAESTRRKRGTAEVDVAFLQEIERWREVLAANFALRNPDLSVRDLNFAVQRTIDRVIFLRMCEDRGIEPYAQLLALCAARTEPRPSGSGRDGTHQGSDAKLYQRLAVLFRRADERYNSSLFYFQPEAGREPPDELTLALELDDKPLKDILRSLYYPESPYEFAVLPPEILGQVYEQFLGKVIRLTKAHRAKVEEKPEVRKAGGVYYTPTYIVDYIVKHTVGKLLEGKTPADVCGTGFQPVKGSRRRGRKGGTIKRKLVRGGAPSMRILDPACGSGSFLLGAYQHLLDWHRDWYVDDGPDNHTDRIYQGPGGQWYLTIAEKKRILLNNIYGVDIDPQAVEVTKLALLLKVLEGESSETIGQTLRLFHERALPDLANNIKCGNSLIGPDFYDNQQLDLLDDDQRYRINAFDWQAEFPQVFATPNPGFDAVIGNPPYIQLAMEAYYSSPVAHYLGARFSSSMGRLNTFGLFFEQAASCLTKTAGLFAFIVPNTILTQGFYEQLRTQLLARTLIRIAVYEYHVFQGAVVEPAVLVVQNTASDQDGVHIEIHAKQGGTVEENRLPQSVFLHTYKHSFTVRADAQTLALKERIDASWPTFGAVLNINQAIALKGDRSLSLHRQPQGRNYFPVLDGREIHRYRLSWSGSFLEYERSRIHSCKRTDIFETPEKILFRRVGEGLTATLDREQFYALNTLVVITPKDLGRSQLRYVLALFNSRLMNFYYRTFLKSTKRTFSEIQARQVGQLPFRAIDFSDHADKTRHDLIVRLVQQMLDLHKQLASAKTPTAKTTIQRQIGATDRQIDKLVYELYGLTDQEIQIVEDDTR